MSKSDSLNKIIELSENEIHVLLFQLDNYKEHDFYHYLSSDEKQRAEKLKVELKKKQFILTRAFLRKILSNCVDKPIEEFIFEYGKQGKPYIKDKINNKAIEFNISHSELHILIAITLENNIGVDIEKVNKNIDFEGLSKRFFSKKESEYLNSLESDKKLDAFYNIWTRKEAFIKATGKGIAYGLDKFSVSTNKGLQSKVETEHKKITNEDWYCFELMDVENYKTALSTNNTGTKVTFCQ